MTLHQLLSLAAPMVLAEIGMITMGVVDTLVVGRIGPDAIGAVGLGNILFVTVTLFGSGLMLGLDPVVSRAYGARRLDEGYRWLLHGLVLALVATVPLMLVVQGLIALLPAFEIEPTVARLVVPYLEISAWGTFPLLLFAACRRFLVATNVARPIAVVVLVGNVINLGVAVALVFGLGPIPALGVVGSAWATLLARASLAVFLVAVLLLAARGRSPKLVEVSRRIELDRLRRLVSLGVPAALQVTLEVGVFAAATALVGRLDVASLSAHQIVMQVATLTFVVPQAIGAAGGVLVGHALGAGQPGLARRNGWTGLAVGTTFMGGAALLFLLAPALLVQAFSADPGVVETGSALFRVAAAFQIFDGLQAAATGVLRGVGDTRTPMVANLAGHWLIGLPVGTVLAFPFGLGVVGMWMGLSLGLILIGAFLLGTWIRRAQGLVRVSAASEPPGAGAAQLDTVAQLPHTVAD